MAKWPYNTSLWQRTRKAQLEHEPMCRMCYEIGYYVAATVVDHIERVRNNPDLAYDGDNLQSLCSDCHDRHKQAMERGKGVPGSKRDGAPLDSKHHWNKS